MSPPRRGTPRRRQPAKRRRPSIEVRDLESLIAQIDALQANSRKGGRSRSDQSELVRLRRLLVEAVANGDEELDDEELDDEELDDEELDDEELDDEELDDDGSWWPRSDWKQYTPAKPIKVKTGLKARSRRGAIGETWWSKRFLAAVEAVTTGGRSTRGRSYARQGQIMDLAVGPGMITARVQGTRSTPYRVRIAMPVADDDEWDRIMVALAGQAGYSARLLAGDIPHEVEDVFAAEGVSLLPSSGSRLSTDCTCPDWANPCKHVAAVCYLVAEAFDRDPFTLLAWRGREREAILHRLRVLRGADAGSAAVDAPVMSAGAPPLAECLLGFWKAGPALSEVRIRPEAGEMPGAVLRQVPRGVLEVRGRDVAELLEPVYEVVTTAAARRALGADGTPRESRTRASTRSRRSAAG